MQDQESTASPEVVITNESLETLKHIDCQVGEIVNGDCSCAKADVAPTTTPTGAKTKRKARSTRRRLNAMINNTSIHFSDTDSEGELAVPRVASPATQKPCGLPKPESNGHLLQPVISVTLDGSDDSSYCGERRNSYLENLTDVDEIYASESENADGKIKVSSSPRGSLSVIDGSQHQGETTEYEDMSNDDEEPAPIYVRPRSDILCDFNGETITTKEGDGPFSVEVRNQMSIDEGEKLPPDTPDIVVMPTTDTEEMEASDEDDEVEGACALRDSFEDLDVLAASQIVMKNVNKMEQMLNVKEPEEAISDNHTDVEDLE